MPDNKPNRARPVHYHLWATEEEAALIKERMAEMGVATFSAFARKMMIDGYHITLDLSDVREMVRLLSITSNNVNQIARRVNETRNIYASDMEDIRQQYSELWAAANKILAGLSKIK